MNEEKKGRKKDYSWRLKGRVSVPGHEQREYEDLWFSFGVRGFKLLKLKEEGAQIEAKALNLNIFPLTDQFLYQSVIALDCREKMEFYFHGPALGNIAGEGGYPDGYKEEEKADLPITRISYCHEFLGPKISFNIKGKIGSPVFYPFYKAGPKTFEVTFEASKEELVRAFESPNLVNGIWGKHEALKRRIYD